MAQRGGAQAPGGTTSDKPAPVAPTTDTPESTEVSAPVTEGPATSGGNLQPAGLDGQSLLANDVNDGPTAQEAAESVQGHRTGQRPGVTRFEGQEPGDTGWTAPGDAPADTTDPRERVSTVIPSGEQMAAAVRRGDGSVVAAVKHAELPTVLAPKGGVRFEEYDVLDGFGKIAGRVRRDLDTGVSEKIG